MKTIRIGNDIDVLWKIYSRDGSQFPLEGKTTTLWLLSGPLKKQITEYSVSTYTLSFTIDKDDLMRLGVYKLLLTVKDENAETDEGAFDITEVFQIVSRSYPDTENNILDGNVVITPASVLNNIVSTGLPGKSSYDIAVEHGYQGTEEQWINDPVPLGAKGIGIEETVITESDESSGVNTVKFVYNTGEEKEFHIKNGKGIVDIHQETIGVGSDAPNIIRASYSDGDSDTFTVKNGAQGNSGAVLEGVTEESFVEDLIVNNLTDGGSTKALSAEMGKTLFSYIRDGYDYRGVATPGGTPATILSGHKVCYLATSPGTYTNFGGVELKSYYVGIIYYDGNGTWSLTNTGIPSAKRVNISSRGVYPDASHLCEFDGHDDYTGYSSTSSYDALWIKILDNCKQLTLSGCVVPNGGPRFCFFSSMNPSTDNFIRYNRTGAVPSGAKLCIVNLTKSDNTDGYDDLNVEQVIGFLDESYFDSIFENYLVSVPSGKNYIDANNVLNGYRIADGKVKAYSGGVMSNRIFLTNGQTYTLSGIPYYGTNNKIYYANYRADGTVVSIAGLSCSHPGDTGYGSASFTFSSNGGQIDHIRICLDSGTSADFDPAIAQLEEGDTATSFEAYSGRDVLDVDRFHCVDDTYFSSLFSDFIRTVPVGKNFLNPEQFLPGYQYNNGRIVSRDDGILSNRLFLEDGKTYTFQGIPYYQTTGYCYYGLFDADNNLVSVKKLSKSDPGNTGYGTGSFKFSSNNGLILYARLLLQSNTSSSLVIENAQLEEGAEATAVEDFEGKDIFVVDTGGSGGDTPIAERRKVRLLCIGNSYTGDAMYYVPFLMPSLAEVDVEIGYLYRDGENLAGHWSNFQNDTTYSFYVYRGKGYWETIGSRTIKQAIAFQRWDIITLQQQQSKTYNWSTYQPYLNNLINGIFAELTYPVKFVWLFGQQCPGSTGSATDQQIIERLQGSWANSQKVLNETLCDAVIPIGTAVQNARTTSLKSLGDFGNLTEEGVHLQDGLPRQIAAYTVCMTLLDLCGFSDKSVYGDTNRVTEEWLDGKNVQQRQGDAVGSSDSNCQIAQKCVVMAHKHPYQITDISQM